MTIAEFSIARAQYGIVKLTLDYDHDQIKLVLCTIATLDFVSYGRGDTEAEAIDDALVRVIHRTGESIRNHQTAVGAT